MIRTLSAVLLATTAVSPASAAVVVTGATSSSFNIAYNGNVATLPVAGLTAAIAFNFLNTSNGGKTYKFSYALTNTSSGPITASTVKGFAFNTTPNVTGAIASGLFSNTHFVNAKYPNEVGKIDVCVTGGNKCQGGANGGVGLGANGSGLFSLSFENAQSQITLDDFFIRYQSITGTNLGTSGTGVGTPVVLAAVPEPATWAMMIGGFGMIGGALRYRRRSITNPARA